MAAQPLNFAFAILGEVLAVFEQCTHHSASSLQKNQLFFALTRESTMEKTTTTAP
jgi:hypothetical protein